MTIACCVLGISVICYWVGFLVALRAPDYRPERAQAEEVSADGQFYVCGQSLAGAASVLGHGLAHGLHTA